MTQLIENPPDFACQDLEKKKNKILVRFISWVKKTIFWPQMSEVGKID